MSAALQKIEQFPMEFTQEKIDLLKNTVCRGASNDEFQLFLHVCKKTGLDPFMKQIYSIPRGGQRTIQTSIDGLRLIAERTNRYSPGRESIFTYGENKELISATSFVKKMTPDGTWHEVAATAIFSEYNPGNNTFWKKMPHVMLAKCAEASALRKAFPAEMSGLYSEEEMHQADSKLINAAPEPIIENAEEIEVKMKQFLIGFEPEEKPLVRQYIEKYAAHWKKGIIKSIEDYSDGDKFIADYTKWKKKQPKQGE